MSDAATVGAAAASGAQSRSRLASWGMWLAAAAIIAALPVVFRSGTALTMMSLMGIAVIFALSYNMLLGQTGMLSFGHAVYYGLGAYFTVHAINTVIQAKMAVPLVVLPLIGGLAGLVFAVIFGWVSTKRSGTAFAMISLGLAELVGSSSLILRSFFGGEEGVSTNRTKLLRIFDWSFGPQIQVYYLIAAWALIAALAMYALTRTPLGRMANAVRDNPERVQFVGYNPQVVRYLVFCLSGFFAGIAGGLVGINFELANAALFGAAQSGNVLLATFIGGAGHFIGPILGAVLVTYLQTMLSDITEVWQLYFGLMFIAVVLYAPGGLAGLIMMHGPAWRARALGRLLPSYALMTIPVLMVTVGAVLVVELVSHLGVKALESPTMKILGYSVDPKGWEVWALAIGLLVVGGVLARLAGARVTAAWERVQATAREKGLTV